MGEKPSSPDKEKDIEHEIPEEDDWNPPHIHVYNPRSHAGMIPKVTGQPVFRIDSLVDRLMDRTSKDKE